MRTTVPLRIFPSTVALSDRSLTPAQELLYFNSPTNRLRMVIIANPFKTMYPIGHLVIKAVPRVVNTQKKLLSEIASVAVFIPMPADPAVVARDSRKDLDGSCALDGVVC